jgi:predicted SAM-dependent methyltransferase
MTARGHAEQRCTGEPLSGKPQPPNGLLSRLAFYGRRNGYAYAALSYLGRSSFRLWCTLAPLFACGKIARWLAQPGPRIVNLGGGSNTFDRWLTADVDPRADVFVDVTKPLPFPSQSIDVIYLEEVIEHISRDDGDRLLGECRRILKPGGALRLTTPCLDLYAAQFDGDTVYERKINDIFYRHGHRYIYSKSGVHTLLEVAGFTAVMESSFRDAASPHGYFDTHALRFAISDRTTTQYWDARVPTSVGSR